jgi:hypothetical protein
MRDAHVDRLQVSWDDYGYVSSIELWVFDDFLTTGGITAWSGDHPVPKECRPIRVPGWYVCSIKGFIVLP